MVWFLASSFFHFLQEKEGPGVEQANPASSWVCWGAAANRAGKLVSVHPVTGALAVQQVYGGRRDGDKGWEAEQCIVAAQECAGLGRAWISSHAAPSHSVS